MSESVVDLAGSYCAAWNAHDLEEILALHTEDSTFAFHIGVPPVVGKSAIRESFAASLRQYADVHFAVERLHVGAGHYVAEMRFSALAVRSRAGQALAGGGVAIEIDLVDVMTVEGGLVKRKDSYTDPVTLRRQLAGAATA